MWLRLTYPKGTSHNSELHKWQRGLSYTVHFSSETSKLDPKGDFPQTLPACAQINIALTTWILVPGAEKMGPNPPAFLEESPIQLHCRENHWSLPATPKSTKPLLREEEYTLQEWSNPGIPPAFPSIHAQPCPGSRACLSNLPLTSRTAPFLMALSPVYTTVTH